MKKIVLLNLVAVFFVTMAYTQISTTLEDSITNKEKAIAVLNSIETVIKKQLPLLIQISTSSIIYQ